MGTNWKKLYTDILIQLQIVIKSVAWQKRWHLVGPPLVSPQNDIWETNVEIQYWWRVTSQIWVVLPIGHLHNDVILLLRPESFSYFLSYLHLVIPWGSNHKSPKSHKKAKPWRMLIVVAKLPIGWNKFPSRHDQSETLLTSSDVSSVWNFYACSSNIISY